MCKPFKSPYIRSSSAAVEGDFNDIKNNVLRGIHKPLRLEKAFIYHLVSTFGVSKEASLKLVTARMQMADKKNQSE